MLIYDQPLNPAKDPVTPDARPAAAGFSVLDLVLLLWRRKIAIASAALICACVAVAIGKSLSPKYTATAQLYVDPRELQLVDRELTPRHQRPVRPAEGIAGTAAQRREHARGLQGAEQLRRHPGHADQRPAALRQQPAARRGARADARRAGQVRPDRSQPQGVDRRRR